MECSGAEDLKICRICQREIGWDDKIFGGRYKLEDAEIAVSAMVISPILFSAGTEYTHGVCRFCVVRILGMGKRVG